MVTMTVEIKDVEHLAGLARLAISDSEKEILRTDLEGILAYVSQVKEVTAEVVAIGVVPELHNVMREDTDTHTPGIFTEDILAGAPSRQGNHLVVKKIL